MANKKLKLKQKNVKKKSVNNSIKNNYKNNVNKKFIFSALIVLIIIAAFLFINNYNKYVGDDDMVNNETNNKLVVLETTKGEIKIELYEDKAPITVENFLKYVDAGHYENIVFHRVIEGFMIQTGGFESNGSQKQTLSPIKLESDNGLKNDRGTVAMARTMVPDSATSQFFINLNNNDFLNYGVRDEGYAVFGKVIEGMDVVDEIAKVQTTRKYGQADWPTNDIVINKAYLE